MGTETDDETPVAPCSRGGAVSADPGPAPDTWDGQRRLLSCVEEWPDCVEGDYNPSCCRFPKSCSCTVYDPSRVSDAQLEPGPDPLAGLRGPAMRQVAVGPLPEPSYHAAADGSPVWLENGDFEGQWAVGIKPDRTVGAKVYTSDGTIRNPRQLAEAILAAEREASS